VLRRFIDNPGLSGTLGEAAARHALDFGWDTSAADTAEVYAAAQHEHRGHLRSAHG
jgi:D-inositol-3-phosphate glycosyltransferase